MKFIASAISNNLSFLNRDFFNRQICVFFSIIRPEMIHAHNWGKCQLFRCRIFPQLFVQPVLHILIFIFHRIWLKIKRKIPRTRACYALSSIRWKRKIYIFSSNWNFTAKNERSTYFRTLIIEIEPKISQLTRETFYRNWRCLKRLQNLFSQEKNKKKTLYKFTQIRLH